jgi:glutaredoxin
LNEIIVFSQPDCPPCEITKLFLKEHGITFIEKNIQVDQKARVELVKKYKCYSTPTIVTGNEVVTGFDLDRLKLLLNIK